MKRKGLIFSVLTFLMIMIMGMLTTTVARISVTKPCQTCGTSATWYYDDLNTTSHYVSYVCPSHHAINTTQKHTDATNYWYSQGASGHQRVCICGRVIDALADHNFKYTYIDETQCKGSCKQCSYTFTQNHKFTVTKNEENDTCESCGYTKGVARSEANQYLAVKNEKTTALTTYINVKGVGTTKARMLEFQDSVPANTTRIYIHHNQTFSIGTTVFLGYYDVETEKNGTLAIVCNYRDPSNAIDLTASTTYKVNIPSSLVYDEWTAFPSNGTVTTISRSMSSDTKLCTAINTSYCDFLYNGVRGDAASLSGVIVDTTTASDSDGVIEIWYGETHDHIMGDWTITIPTTCLTDGKQERYCINGTCNYTEEQTIPAPGHIYANACPKCSTAKVVCSGCGLVKDHDTTAPTINSLTASSSTYTGSSITLTGKAIDSCTGIVGYAFTSSSTAPSSYTEVTTTNSEISQTYSVTNSGTYYFWVKDGAGNINSKSITISKKAITVNKTNYSADYDGSSHTFTLTTTPSSNVTIYYSTSTVLTASNYTSGSTTKPTRTDYGTTTVYYYVHDTSGNYSDYASNANSNNGTITINKKAVTITAKDQSIKSGANIATGVNQVTATGLISGHSVSAITLTQSTWSVGTGTITPSAGKIANASGTDVTSNYNITYAKGTLTVSNTTMSVTASDYNGTYDGSSHTITLNVTTPSSGATIYYSTSTALTASNYSTSGTTTKPTRTSVGTTTVYYYIVASGYDAVSGSKKITINARPVTITAKDQTITYGSSIATGVGQVTVTGLLSGHSLDAITLTPSISTPGTGTITPSAATIESASITSNYNITYVAGTLKINKKAVTITAKAQTITYGSSIATGVSQVTVSGLLSGHSLDAITLSASISTPGTGKITPSGATIENATITSYYDITYVAGTLTINKKALTITAKDQIITYGSSIATGVGQVTTSGLLSGHSLDAITLTPSRSTVGTGTITPSGATIENATITSYYDITYVAGTLTISTTAMSVTAADYKGIYDGSAHTITLNITNPSSGVTIYYSTITALTASNYTSGSTTKPTRTDVGTTTVYYYIVASGYDAVSGSKNITITSRELRIMAVPQTITYGESIVTGVEQVTTNELISGHTLSSITLTPSISTVGKGIITPSGAIVKNGTTDVTSNYEIKYSTGELTIKKKNVVVTAKSQRITYGESIAIGLEQVTTTGLLSDHSLSEITLNPDISTVGTGWITPSAGKIVNLNGTDVTSNYNLYYSTGALAIDKKPVTITAKDQSISSGANIATGVNQVTVSGLLSNHSLDAITLTQSTWSAGTGTITPSAATIESSTITAYYDITYIPGKLTVSNNTMVVSASDYNNTYDGSSHTITLNVTTPSSGATIYYSTSTALTASNYSTSGTTTKPTRTDVGTTTVYYYIVANNYNAVSGSKKIIINARPVTITAKNQTITYGDSMATGVNQVTVSGLLSGHSLSAVTLTSSISTPGTGTITPSAGTIKNGSSDVTSNYTITYEKGTIIINKKSVTITAKDQTITYGDSIATGVNQVTVSGLLSGHSLSAITLTPSISTPGTGKITPSGATIGNATITSYYDIKYVDGTLTINKKSVTITANPQTITYGSSIATGVNQVTVSGLLSGHSLSAITLTPSISTPGTGKITPSGATIGNATITSYYDIKYVDGTLTINKKSVTITAKDQTITYGDSIATGVVQVTVSGLLSGHSLDAITLTPSRSTVGTGKITPSGATIENATITSYYDIKYVDGTLTINKKAVTITAKDQTITYGESIAIGVGQVTVSGLVNGHSLDAITLTPSRSTVGTGKITPSGATIESADITTNYDIKYVEGKLTINKKSVTITANPQTITYGESIATGVGQVTVSGLVNGHSLDAITLTPSRSTVGTGKITPSGATIESADITTNYDIKYVAGTLTINKKKITLTWGTTDLLYKAKPQVPTVLTPVDGVYGEKINITVSGHGEDVGNYTARATMASVTNGNKDINNYELTNSTIDFTIRPDPDIEFVVTLDKYLYVWDGNEHRPTATVKATVDGIEYTLVLDKDYTVTYKDNIEPGTATAIITGINNYGESDAEVEFKIDKAIRNAVVIMGNYIYAGTMVSPSINDTTDEDGETVYYYNTVNSTTNGINWNTVTSSTQLPVGTYYMYATIGETAHYKAETTPTTMFKIEKGKAIEPTVENKVYNGKEQVGVYGEVGITITGVTKATEVGTYIAYGTLDSNYEWEYSETTREYIWTISAGDINEATVRLEPYTFKYNGEAHEPNVIMDVRGVVLVKDKDFTVSYRNNIEVGTAEAIITGIGNFKGTRTEKFEITKANIDKLILEDVEHYYTGSEIRPLEKVYDIYGKLLIKDKDYTVYYVNNINIGTGVLGVVGKGNYSGMLETTFAIRGGLIENAEITLNGLPYTYDGNEKCPEVMINLNGEILELGKDFKVSYENNINAGENTAKVNIIGIGAYEGSVQRTFTIHKADREATIEPGKSVVVGAVAKIEYLIKGEFGNISVTVEDTTIGTLNTKTFENIGTIDITALKEGRTPVKLVIPATDNYNETVLNSELVVLENVDKTYPIFGSVIINGGDEYTKSPRTLLTLNVDFGDYMYISESNVTPSLDASEWYEYSEKMPYQFDSTEGTKVIYVWFKDKKGNMSEVATDSIILDYDADVPVHDSVLLDQTEIDKTAPDVNNYQNHNTNVDMKVIFKQEDVMVNGVRSGVDKTTIKYGYKELGSTADYTWQTSDIVKGLSYNKQYVFVTQASDRAGNGPTISEETIVQIERRYETVITLKDINIAYDGTIKNIEKAEVKLVDNVAITGEITYTYYVDKACTIPTTSSRDGSAKEGSAPSNPGIYYVKAELTEDEVYFDAVSNVAELRIGWDISKSANDDVFAYVERIDPNKDEFILHVIGDGEMADLDDLLINSDDESEIYWSDYKDKIIELEIANEGNESITNIGSDIFSDLTKITEIIIPDTIVNIGDNAFENCTNVTEPIIIPSSVEEIGTGAFINVNTPAFEVEKGNDNYDSIDGVLTDNEQKELIAYPNGKTDSKYTIPDTIETIKENAFTGADNLTNVVIPNGVEVIEPKAFYDCPNLKVIEIEDLMDSLDNVIDLKSVGSKAFENIAEGSIIYTFSEDVAKKFVDDKTHLAKDTDVYWPPVITLHPIDMNGAVSTTVKFIVEAKAGYPAEIKYQWFKVKDNVESAINDATTNEYITPSLTLDNDNEEYYCRVYNVQYYYDRGYVNSNKAKLTMINNANYVVERGSYNSYLFEVLEDAFEFAENGDIVKPLKTINNEGNAKLDSNKSITLDLDGYTINLKGIISIDKDSKIEVIGNGSIVKSAEEYIFENKGELVLNGEIDLTNNAGYGINTLEGSKVEITKANINVDSNAIYAQNAEVMINGSEVNITASTSKEKASAISLYGDIKFNMTDGNILMKYTTEVANGSINGIYIVGSNKGITNISGGTIQAISTDGKADAIVNAGKSDILISGTTNIEGSRSGISNISSNLYGDIIVTDGTIIGGEFGILNNASAAKVVLGTKGAGVSTATPVVVGEKAAIFNTKENNTLEVYDGVLYSHSANVIYEAINNTNLELSNANTDSIYTEDGRLDIITEDKYSFTVEENVSYNSSTYKKAYLIEDKAPTLSGITDKTVEEGDKGTFEIIAEGGQPDNYEYQWEVSTDGGYTWTKLTVGTGYNTNKYTTPIANMSMDGFQYRCIVFNNKIKVISPAVTLTVISKESASDQRPVVRIVFTDGNIVTYDNDKKLVNMQFIIKSFDKLESIKVNGESIYTLDATGNVIESAYSDKSLMEFINDSANSIYDLIAIEKTINGEKKVVEYTYTYNVKVYKNSIITVDATDVQARTNKTTQTIDLFTDLKVDYAISKLTNTNNKVTVTFYANKPVKPIKSQANSYLNSTYAELIALDNNTYSYRYILKLENSLPMTEFWFEDEHNNQTSVIVEAIDRVRYRDIKFINGMLQIEDLNMVNAFEIAQNLENVVEVNSNEEIQTRYGLNNVQSDMFMSRARDLGAMEILSGSKSAKSYNGALTSKMDSTVTTQDSEYSFIAQAGNIFVAAAAKYQSNEALREETGKDIDIESSATRKYIDIISKELSLYKGMNISGFELNDAAPYMFNDGSGVTNIDADSVIDATFRATIIAK